MAKDFAAVANFNGAEASEACPKEALKAIEEVLAVKGTGDELSAEELAALQGAIAAIGSCETGVSDCGSFQGSGKYGYEAEGAGLKVAADVDFGCKGVMDRFRMEWDMNLAVKKIEGDAEALELNWEYTVLSLGTKDDTGAASIILANKYYRTVSDPISLAKFNAGEEIKCTRIDISSFAQWGFAIFGKCAISTTEGTLVL